MAEPVNRPSSTQLVFLCAESHAVVDQNAHKRDVLRSSSGMKCERGEVSIEDRLVDSLDDSLSCPLCLGPLRNATLVSPCGHAFCMPCLEQVLAVNGGRGSTQCPSCRGTILRDFLTPALMQRGLVARLRVRCPYGVVRIDAANGSTKFALLKQPTGCDAEYPLEAHDAHMATCRFAQVFCKHCTFTTYRMAIHQHEQKCKYVRVECPAAWEGCLWSGCRKDLRKHLKRCTPKPVAQETARRPGAVERRLEVGGYVYLLLNGGGMIDSQPGSLILRVTDIQPSGLLKLEGLEGCTLTAHIKNCVPYA